MALDLSADKPSADTLADATAIADAFTKIETNVNALPIAQLAGYPADVTKVLHGDGSWTAVAGTTYRKTTAKAVNTTTAATDLLNGEITVGAGVLGTTGVLRLTAWGDFLNNSGGSVGPPRFQVQLGGTTMIDTGTGGNVASNTVRRGWRLVVEIMNAGAANSQIANLNAIMSTVSNTAGTTGFTTGSGTVWEDGTSIVLMEGINTGLAVDTTASKALVLNVINGSANAAYETKLFGGLVEVV
jgi:hypothetical protein